MIKNYLLGTDPEVFLKNVITNTIITAEGIIKGSKNNPKKLDREGCAIQLDNVCFEFNVPPTSNPQNMYDNINYVLNTVTGTLPEGIEITIIPSATLEDEQLKSEHAQTMGCDPSFDAWRQTINVRPDLSQNPNLRCAGGHIHIGYENPDVNTSEQIIKALDLFLGVPSILMDTDVERKKLYGKAGEFRFTDYGCEYRVLSNFWISSREKINFIFNQVQKAVNFVNAGNVIETESELGLEIVTAINTQNTELAIKIIKSLSVLEENVIKTYATTIT